MKKRILYLIPFVLVASGLCLKRDTKHIDSFNASKPTKFHQAPQVPLPIEPPTAPATPDALAKLALLRSILASGNDADPRLDRDFRELSPELKNTLQIEYRRLPAEKRNARGTIVFLLGREIRDPRDLIFFEEILNEDPCGSLVDCARSAAIQPSRSQDTEINPAIEVTLAYPQLVALKSLERLLGDRNTPLPLRERARALVRDARDSRVKAVAQAAARLTQG